MRPLLSVKVTKTLVVPAWEGWVGVNKNSYVEDIWMKDWDGGEVMNLIIRGLHPSGSENDGSW